MTQQDTPQTYDRIRLPSAYELVARQIEERIVAGNLRPGDEIGTEAELVRQFGVNRSTVREGIRMLEQSGLVRREAGRRLCVSRPQYLNLSSRMSRAMILNEVTFQELFDTALILETAAALAAAALRGNGHIQALRDNLAACDAARSDPARLAELDNDFHRLISKASGNRVLELAREPAAMLYFPTTEVIFRSVPEAAGRLLTAHAEIIDAIERGDGPAAGQWMHRHVTDWHRGFVRAGRDPASPVERGLAVWHDEAND